MPLNAAQRAEVKELQAETQQTRRETVPALEAMLYEAIPLLDHGFIRVIDYMGSDSAVVQAARVSYGRGTKKISEDAGLLAYLLRHRHTTPFEMCEIKLHIKLPIFIARQWIRHRTASVNEYSGRYSIMDREFYLPAPEQLAVQSKTNRQGRGETLAGPQAARVLELLRDDAERNYAHYEEMLGGPESDDNEGLARELARMNLTLNYYTQWYWKIDLHNLMHFLALRADTHAQYEIRVYAEAMMRVLEAWVPLTYKAFMNYRVGAAELSAGALSAVRNMLAGQTVNQETSGLSKGEWRELMSILKINQDTV